MLTENRTTQDQTFTSLQPLIDFAKKGLVFEGVGENLQKEVLIEADRETKRAKANMKW